MKKIQTRPVGLGNSPFASEVEELLTRKGVKKDQIEKVWTKHQCSRFGSFRIYQKLDSDAYEIGDIYFPSLYHMTGNALLVTKKSAWNSTGRAGSLTVRLLGNESVKLNNGFTKEVMKFEESAECDALYKRLE